VTSHGIDGLIVEPKKPTELASLIAQLDDDRHLLRRLGGAARQKAVDDFDEQLVVQRTIDVYNELLAP
jgi:glycosyltransferase involved in cell wall biosynthesis